MDITTRTLDSSVAVIACDGRLNMVSARALKSAIDKAVEGGHTRLVVDLASTSFVDSSGLGALVAGLKRARQADGDLRVAGAKDQVLTVMGLTNLDRVLKPYPTVEDATDGW